MPRLRLVLPGSHHRLEPQKTSELPPLSSRRKHGAMLDLPRFPGRRRGGARDVRPPLPRRLPCANGRRRRHGHYTTRLAHGVSELSHSLARGSSMVSRGTTAIPSTSPGKRLSPRCWPRCRRSTTKTTRRNIGRRQRVSTTPSLRPPPRPLRLRATSGLSQRDALLHRHRRRSRDKSRVDL